MTNCFMENLDKRCLFCCTGEPTSEPPSSEPSARLKYRKNNQAKIPKAEAEPEPSSEPEPEAEAEPEPSTNGKKSGNRKGNG